MADSLFNKKFLSVLLRSYPQVLQNQVDSLNDDLLLQKDESDLVDRLVERMELVAPTLRPKDEWAQKVEDTKIDVSGNPLRGLSARLGRRSLVPAHRVIIEIPFDGDADLFEVQPSRYSLRLPCGHVSKATSILSFSIIEEHLDADKIGREIDSIVSNIRTHLEQVRIDCRGWNSGLRETVTASIRARKDRLLQQDKLGDSLGIPAKDDDKETRKTYTVSTIRRLKPRALSTSSANREPTLSSEDYDYILGVISKLGSDMEKTPETYMAMDEERIRDHILSTLSTHVEGGTATRETYNKEGKTDILIQIDGKNIFVAECKIWKGEKSFRAAIDQTLGYLTWRDTKAALIVFSKNRDFTNVLSTISASVPCHANHKRTLEEMGESQGRYIFQHKDDAEREFRLAVLAFNFFASDS